MKPTAILTTIPSDSHNWNLIFIELLLKEEGYHVKNLGACVPFDLTLNACQKYKPDVVIVSTINGHGFIEGISLVKQLRREFTDDLPIYIGGKISTDVTMSSLYAAELEQAGYTKAYTRDEDLPDFKNQLKKLIAKEMVVESK